MTEPTITVHRLNRMSNFFLVVEGDELTLIDTGNKDTVESIRAKFERVGHELSRLDRIVVTHSHFDHTGALAAIRGEASDARVCAHEDEVPYLTHEARLPRPKGLGGKLFQIIEPFFRSPPTTVEVALKDGDAIEGTGLQVIHVPGHTPGSICLYHPGAKTLFTGDAILNRNDNITGPILFFCSDAKQARQSVSRLADLDLETIHFAHGKTIKADANQAIKNLCATLKI